MIRRVYDSVVRIDQGTSNGIESGDPVVAPLPDAAVSNGKTYNGSLVGVVMDGCTANTCPVRLITDPTQGIGYSAKVLGTSAQGILQPAAGTSDIFNLTLVPVAVNVPVGGIGHHCHHGLEPTALASDPRASRSGGCSTSRRPTMAAPARRSRSSRSPTSSPSTTCS